MGMSCTVCACAKNVIKVITKKCFENIAFKYCNALRFSVKKKYLCFQPGVKCKLLKYKRLFNMPLFLLLTSRQWKPKVTKLEYPLTTLYYFDNR